MASAKIVAGILLCGQIRRFLEAECFKDSSVSFIESKGWIDRQFVIKGPNEKVTRLYNAIMEWAKDDE